MEVASVPPRSDDPPAMTSHGGGGRDLDQAISALRDRVDEEFRVAERLDSKGRQAFALAAGFFAVVQTVTFGSFAQRGIQADERILMLLVAVVAGAALVFVAYRLTRGEKLLEEADLRPQAVVEWCEEAGNDPEYVSVRLVRELSRVAQRRAENNAIRTRNFDRVAAATPVALVIAGAELATAIAVRI